ncbi:hypothetical protein AOXY_G18867 [Acipenser oxyrinchus oxyrinchus]|uniref:Uncharacterized protein n=1 Tax=Acipenser oxyrinchus oxyrinchus TaxID=40147 RepID=A0AAD8D0B4_ACIOX|nr:hypothetical protein AOXY_G18867 [Acipenser oxyrinchus oxyrinchus]
MRAAGLQLSCFCWRIGPHTAGKGAMIKVLPSPVEFLRISDRDLTEIELHSVESISDLQRLNSNSELLKTPQVWVCTHRPGALLATRTMGTSQPGPGWRAVLWPQRSCCTCCSPVCCRYLWVCIAVLLASSSAGIFYFLVQQNESLYSLSLAIKQRKEFVKELAQLAQTLKELRVNLTPT